MTLNQLFWKLTKERLTLHEVSFEEAVKISSLLSIMLHIRQSVYLVLINVLSTSFLMFHITFDEISTTLSVQFW